MRESLSLGMRLPCLFCVSSQWQFHDGLVRNAALVKVSLAMQLRKINGLQA